MGKVVGGKLHNSWLNQALIDSYSELGHYFYNGTGGSLVAGTPVYKSGTDTTTLFPKVTKAISTSAAVGATYIVLEDVASTGIGILVKAGKILTALDASGGAVGDNVYLHSASGVLSLVTSGIGQVVGHVATATNPAYVDFDIDGIGATAGTSSLLSLANAWTNTNDFSASVTGTDELINADLSINHATQIGVAVDATAVQITTARTSNYIAAFRGSTTSLAGDTATVIYPTFLAAAPVDGGAALHHAYKTAAGYDATIDAQSAATGENDWIVGANLADALTIRTTAISYITIGTSTATPGIIETWARTGTGAAHTVTNNLNSATSVGQAIRAQLVQTTTARTDTNPVAAFDARVTSLAGDLNNPVYCGFFANTPTDGGGAVTHAAFFASPGHDFSLMAADNARIGFGDGALSVPDASLGWDATQLTLLAAVDDTVFKIGNGTQSLDLWVYGNIAGDYLLWDASASTLSFVGTTSLQGIRTSSSSAAAITTTRALALADSGGVFSVSQAAAYDIDLPSPTTGPGTEFEFYLTGAAANNVTITVAGSAATFVGTITIDGATIPATGSTLTFASGSAVLGDNIRIRAISTALYLVVASASGAGGITIT